MSSPQTLPDTLSATSLPASGAGPWPFALHAGPPSGPCGPARARASRSRSRGSGAVKQTSATCGLCGSGSSASAALNVSLANKLRARLGTGGSMEFVQTWRAKVTPSGRLYWEHTASGRRTGDNDCGGLRPWVSPTSQDAVRGGLPPRPWDTGVPLSQQVAWATPSARDYRDGRASPETMGRNARPLNEQAVMLAAWTTPQTHDAQGSGQAERLKRHGTAHGCKNLQDEAHLRETVTGATLSSCPAQTGKPGASLCLNPAFSLWLMGYPEAWLCSVPNYASWRAWQELMEKASKPLRPQDVSD